MKYISFFLFLWILFGAGVHAAIDDNSIIDELTQENTQELGIDYTLKNFESCSAFEEVMEEYYKSYWENNSGNRGWYNVFSMQPEMMEMDAMSDQAVTQESSNAGSTGDDYSKTNTQVVGVDEADIVKTDGKYHYYYNQTENAVFIIRASQSGASDELEVVKKFNLPKNFYSPELYVDDNRLVIIATGYSNTDYSSRGFYVNRNTKTYTIIFDTTNKREPELLRLYSSDGDYGKSRKIGDTLYVLSRNYMNFPYWNYKNVDDIEIDAQSILPQSINISRTSNAGDQNLVLSGKQYPYSVDAGSVSDCSDISYNLPDEETLKNTSFNPGYNIISAIDISKSDSPVKTQVIAGSNTEIYMSEDNLYLTEGIWTQDNFSCPPNAMCAMPFFWGGSQNTLLHKLNIDGQSISYQESALIPGSPLNQYSMDEFEGNFRIITSQWSPERSTGLYVLDSDLKKVSSLTNLAPGETFQSSRFIGDKLFLVTFEQIDPLFAIDISDIKNPTVLGELKIPGFSTYLHPYDENHLIGLGYDTQVNEWGGTQTSGVKVDLYKMNYDKKCGDSGLTAEQNKKCESGDYKGIIVEQLYSETLGGKGSYSEALNNPRMFIWNKNRKTLLLPVTLYEKDEQWITQDYYNGLASIKIDAATGIDVENKITHINTDELETQREEACEKYTGTETEPVCRELLNGEMSCSAPSKQYVNIPNYCYKDASIWQYVGDTSWEFGDVQIKRALYIGNEVYAFSDSAIGSYDWNLKQNTKVDF